MPATILIVDDDLDARLIYQDTLVQRGYRVLTAVHGAEGVHLARKHRPDLILMDIRMPLMDGWSAIRYVKSDQATAHIPIWVVTAYAADERGRDATERPRFDRMIAKPIEPADLAAEIEDHFRRPSYH